jgi:hypothetical protein
MDQPFGSGHTHHVDSLQGEGRVWKCGRPARVDTIRRTNVVGFAKVAAKSIGEARTIAAEILTHVPLAGEVSPRVCLLVEAEDLHGG